MSLGALGYVGYGVETTEGVFVAPTKFLPVSSFSFEDTNDYVVPDQIRNTRDRSVAMAAPYMTSGTMEMELIPNDISTLLKSAFAASVTSSAYAGGGYQHAMTPGDTSPTLSFESNAADILVMRYGGIRVNTLEIKAAFGEIVTSSWGLEGTTRQSMGSSQTAQTYTDVLPLHFTGADVFVAGGQNVMVKDFTFSVGNNIERIGTLRKTRSWRRTALGMRDTGLSMTLDFTDSSEYDRFLAESEFVVKLHMSGSAGQSGMGSNSPILEITLNRVRWNKVGIPLSASDYLEQAVEALVLKPNSGNVFDAKLICTEQTVP